MSTTGELDARFVQASMPAPSLFARFAWGVLGYNILVVLWGAYVRASGSGAGCGSHWPLCNGEVIPRAPQLATLIEFTHRIMSGISLAAVAVLWVWSRRFDPRVRTAATLSAVLLVVEALLGAGLVLFEYVAHNASVGRAFYLSAHLANTQLLLAALTATAWLAQHAPPKRMGTACKIALLVAIGVSVTGAIAALGDTLLAAGVAAQFLVRLRVLHPFLAIAGGGYIALVAMKRRGFAVVVLVLLQLAAGAANIALLAPVGMQIFHLLLADILWVALVLLTLQPDRI